MKSLNKIIESLLDDEDTLAYNPLEEIQRFLTKTYGKYSNFKIEEGSDGIYIVTSGVRILSVNDPDATRLTNGLFRFSPKLDRLNCYNCTKLQSLEGCPEECARIDCRGCKSLKNLIGAPKNCTVFICMECDSLESLEGGPQKCDSFNCDVCPKLKTLIGSPKVCGKFTCAYCDGLKDLTGAPQKCTEFSCSGCKNLTSLKGAPQKCKYFYCVKCPKLTTLKYLGKVEYLYTRGTNIPEEELDELDKKMKIN